MNVFLVINCALSLANCQMPGAPAGLYAGQPVLIDMAPRETCETLAKNSDRKNATLAPKSHSVCVEIKIDKTGGWDAADADGGASVWVAVIAATDAAASAADGPPAGMIPAFGFTNNSQCVAQLPKVEPGRMYPVCAKVPVYGNGK